MTGGVVLRFVFWIYGGLPRPYIVLLLTYCIALEAGGGEMKTHEVHTEKGNSIKGSM